METGAINYTLRQPLGVVAGISPWNLPLYLLTWKIAPALAAGNCVVAKPSEVTPFTASMLAERCIEAGLPRGVLNIVHGHGTQVGNAIVMHPEVRAISFTGGTATGRHIAAAAAPQFKKLSLELGGKNPSARVRRLRLRGRDRRHGACRICEPGRDLPVRLARSGGTLDLRALPRCVRGSRPGAARRRPGLCRYRPGRPRIRRAPRQGACGAIELARTEGGRILCGGKRGECRGLALPRGLVRRAHADRRPAAAPAGPTRRRSSARWPRFCPSTNEAEALAIANGTPYGLAASVWSRDTARCHRVAAQLEAGLVWVNTWMLRDLRTPIGGVKHSGVGREGGFEALRFFTEPSNVCIKYLTVTSHRPCPTSFSPPRAPGAARPLPARRRVGNLLFLSGMGPRRRGEKEIPGVELDAGGRRRRATTSRRSAARCSRTCASSSRTPGSSWERLVDVTVFLTDLERDFATYNRLYAEYFGKVQPCRTTVGVATTARADRDRAQVHRHTAVRTEPPTMRPIQALQLPPVDRRAPPPAQAAGRQQEGLPGRRVHRHGRRRAELAQGLPRRPGRGVLLPARRRHGAEDHAGRAARRHPDPRRRDLPAAAARAALAAALCRHGGPGHRAQAPRRRAKTGCSGTARTATRCSTKSTSSSTNIETQFPPVFERFFASLEHRTCKQCGAVMQPPPKPPTRVDARQWPVR